MTPILVITTGDEEKTLQPSNTELFPLFLIFFFWGGEGAGVHTLAT